jgi:NADPH:quinone reductase-like Zn-dependent oxidoreductase
MDASRQVFREILMAQAVLFDELGGPEVLKIAEVPVAEPDADEVRIRVDAIGLNRAEAMFRAGTYYEQPKLPGSGLGYEAAGVVEAVGSGVSGLAVGEPISTISAFSMRDYGVYGDRVIVPSRAVVSRADAVDAVTGAAIWTNYATAYGALVEQAEMRPGDNVLITAASSGVGLAAIQIANNFGAIPIAVTRGEGKRRKLLDAGAARVISTESQDLVEDVLAATDGAGARVVFDCVGGPFVNDLERAASVNGVLIIYGWLSLEPTPLPMNWFKNLAVYGYALDSHVLADPARWRRAEQYINAGLRVGSLVPTIDRVFDSLDDIPEAQRYLESNEQIGKVVVRVRH